MDLSCGRLCGLAVCERVDLYKQRERERKTQKERDRPRVDHTDAGIYVNDDHDDDEDDESNGEFIRRSMKL